MTPPSGESVPKHRYDEATDSCIDCGRQAPNCTCMSEWGLHCFFHKSVEVCPARSVSSGGTVNETGSSLQDEGPPETIVEGVPSGGDAR